ncbi:predicted protein [Botrytis cinerea T4]|uniref:Uncharacterized protein n=1 Tax=Botryotinia fuckeliana (strain T4) TaxID=999810 RepID=G2XVA1_BOTF4|nr:predicted protein [Botrytis cinerea T4]
MTLMSSYQRIMHQIPKSAPINHYDGTLGTLMALALGRQHDETEYLIEKTLF